MRFLLPGMMPTVCVMAIIAAPSALSAYEPVDPAPAKQVAAVEKNSIVATAAAAGRFNTLLRLASDAGLVETLSGAGPLTVFAPTDEAFAKLPAETLAGLANDKEALKFLLLNHVVEGRLASKALMGLSEAKMLGGGSTKIAAKDRSLYVNDVRVTTPDLMASNGVIHAIDSVLVPQAADKDIVATVVDAGNFEMLNTLLKRADLVETLQGPGPFTIFAPTDEAFEKVSMGTRLSLMRDKKKLVRMLTYHVVPGNLTAADVSKLTEAKTVEGSALRIALVDGKVVLNGVSAVTASDMKASNGMIHVVDTVIMPPEK